MNTTLKEKLWAYISQNNPEVLIRLHEDYSVSDYLNQKISGIQPLVDELAADATPKYIVEEICLNVLTEELKPSRFNYIRSILEEEFEASFLHFQEAGILTYEIVNLINNCNELFDAIGFTIENEDDNSLRNAITGQIADYLN